MLASCETVVVVACTHARTDGPPCALTRMNSHKNCHLVMALKIWLDGKPLRAGTKALPVDLKVTFLTPHEIHVIGVVTSRSTSPRARAECLVDLQDPNLLHCGH